MTTHGDPYRKLTKDESELRLQADKRAFRQQWIDTLVDLKISYARLMAYLNRNRLPDTDRYPASQWSLTQWAEKDTIQVPVMTLTPAQHLQFPMTGPITGENSMDDLQGQVGKPTTSHQYEELKQQEKAQLILHGRETIKQFFYGHSEHMPKLIRMSLKNSIKISDLLEEGKFFPETNVHVHFDLHLNDDQFICE